MATKEQQAFQQQAAAWLQMPNVRMALDAIGAVEGADWDMLVGDQPGAGSIRDTSRHPGVTKAITHKTPDGKTKTTMTSAAGKFQFTRDTYKGLAKVTGLSDFTPRSQEINALALIKEVGGIEPILKGDWDAAFKKLGTKWAGVPGSSLAKQAGQKSRSQAFLQGTLLASAKRLGVPLETLGAKDAFSRTQGIVPTPASIADADDVKTIGQQAGEALAPIASAVATGGARGTPASLSPDDLLTMLRTGLSPAALTGALQDVVQPRLNTTGIESLAADEDQLKQAEAGAQQSALDALQAEQALAAMNARPQTTDPEVSQLADLFTSDLADEVRQQAVTDVTGIASTPRLTLPASIEAMITRLVRGENDGGQTV